MSTALTTTNAQAHALYCARVPPEGPKSVPQYLPFVTDPPDSGIFAVSTVLIVQQAQISGLQAAYVDNSANSVALSLYTQSLNCKVTVKAGYQGIVPVFLDNQGTLYFESPGATADLTVQLLNFPMPFYLAPAT